MNKMSSVSRIVVAIASLSLIATYFFPLWFIFLLAPQYPEGLTMNIWLYQITGQVDIINGLNHYIGMKHIKAEMFPEFGFLVYIMGFFIAFGLLVAIIGKRKWLLAYIIIMILGGVAAMVDFYLWSYDYGHNLDPTAAIQIPGFSYQPPLLGHKTLLNFDAYSYPDTGGWIVIVAACILMITWILEWRKSRKAKQGKVVSSKKIATATVAISMLTLSACSTEPEPMNYGKDMCADCKMTIMDPKFGGEIITKKGKIFKFDDAHCVANFINKDNVKPADVSQVVFADFMNNEKFIDSKTLFFVVGEAFKSPMNSNAGAFSTKEAADAKAREMNARIMSWDEFVKTVK